MIEKREITTDVVSVGTIVRLRDVGAKETMEYAIVGSAEANPAENKLSNESPVGRAILGRKKGETVEVAAPRGSLKYKIMTSRRIVRAWPRAPAGRAAPPASTHGALGVSAVFESFRERQAGRRPRSDEARALATTTSSRPSS